MDDLSNLHGGVGDEDQLRAELEELSTLENKQPTKEELEEKKKEEVRRKRREEARRERKRKAKIERRVRFENNIDLGTLIVIGFVFFLTSFIGMLYNVSPKVLSVRVLISCLIASIFVFICRSAIKKFYNLEIDEATSEEKLAEKAEDNHSEEKTEDNE